MNSKELKSILASHKKWLAYKPGGVRADLSNADLRNLDLCGANLSGAILAGADLTRADLSGANLARADLHGANLTMAMLCGANLSGTILVRANLCNTRFAKAKLGEADLTGANLDTADLEHADIYNAELDPKEEFRKGIVLKKAINGYKNTREGVVITVEIPAGAVVFAINGRKCRTSTATIVDMAGRKLLHSIYAHKFTYRLGQKIIIPDFDTRYNVECSAGFHFFRTKKEAKDY